jgi:hypothetical protein
MTGFQLLKETWRSKADFEIAGQTEKVYDARAFLC